MGGKVLPSTIPPKHGSRTYWCEVVLTCTGLFCPYSSQPEVKPPSPPNWKIHSGYSTVDRKGREETLQTLVHTTCQCLCVCVCPASAPVPNINAQRVRDHTPMTCHPSNTRWTFRESFVQFSALCFSVTPYLSLPTTPRSLLDITHTFASSASCDQNRFKIGDITFCASVSQWQ